MSTTAHALTDLLTRAGARIYGNGRADCPRCKRPRAVSFDESRGVYFCHGAGCDFSGGTAKLAREQGLAKRLTPAEYREVCDNRERADRAARAIFERVRARRSELLDNLHALNRIEQGAHTVGSGSPDVWGALALVCRERPLILAELTILEDSPPTHLIRFLAMNPEDSKREVDRVLIRGGVFDARGRFAEVTGL
jgi:ribosomal protein L37AE/L43A